ncbi:MAG: hypothetical protein ABIU30_18555 [Ferruginibacter sp.]
MLDNTEFRRQNRLHAKNTKEALQENFLPGTGETKRFAQGPIIFDALEAVMMQYGELFVKVFADELDKQDANASGLLTSKTRFEFSIAGNFYQTKFYMPSYAKFVDEGVQGIDPALSKNLTSPYRFKFLTPSKKHIEALEKWIAEKNVTAIITVPKGIISKTLSQKSLAYAIGYSIKKRGLKATYFKKTVIERLIDDFKADVAKAVNEDVTVNIIL